MVASLRRLGLIGMAITAGVLLLVGGIAVAAVDAQLRSDAATAAVTLTAEERRQLEEAGIPESVGTDTGYFRRSLIMENLSSGGDMPERAFEIHEMEDGNVSISWGGYRAEYTVISWGGWQLQPIGIPAFTGLALIIGAVFAGAARWQSRHPLARN
ncbi:hypothetical protein [Mycetocola sp.]|jgi:hypothetical protein|uniref:hypothetical protein n=1 Tax=Mycetocola sp. TaxID=1871042 RepID=UPI0026164D00|nr:hypothetical protein [Mycetocola sp.]MCU1418928.1 hypothetical protein [Mycetocola sp.]MCU1559263.1 hypothetical protein [Mycetocola sp.]